MPTPTWEEQAVYMVVLQILADAHDRLVEGELARGLAGQPAPSNWLAKMYVNVRCEYARLPGLTHDERTKMLEAWGVS